jgi:hypothetical protein
MAAANGDYVARVGLWRRAVGWPALVFSLSACGGSDDVSGSGATATPVVHEGDATVGADADVSLLAGVTEITGSLRIDGAAVTTLAGLESLRTIGVELRVTNTSLVNLAGLDGLERVEEFVWIEQNQSMLDLSGLGKLKSTGWSTVVGANWELLSLRGLESLTAVDGQLSITDNVRLSDISALASLMTLGDNLNVYNNFQISECAVEELRQRLLANGWTGGGTINGLTSCSGSCSGAVCIEG